MAKKGPPPKAEKDTAERWLLSYADFITLLLVFFIVLYSMSSLEVSKFNALSSELSIVFGGVGRSGLLEGGRSAIAGPKTYKSMNQLKNTEEKIRRMIAQMGLEGKISTQLEERGLVITMKDSVLFGVGSGEMNSTAQSIVTAIAQILRDMPNQIRVEGHTDNTPIRTAKYFSNWELSTARATSVLQFLIGKGRIEPSRLSAAGYAEFKSIVKNKDERTRSLNRRVDIVLLSDAFNKFEPNQENNFFKNFTPAGDTNSTAAAPPEPATDDEEALDTEPDFSLEEDSSEEHF